MNRIPVLLCLLSVAFAEGEEPKKQSKQTTKSGLEYWVLNEGKAGTRPARGDRVRMHFSGWLEDGRKLQSTRDAGKPLNVMAGVGMLKIKGLEEGVMLMNQGAKFKFHIPAALAFGAKGLGRVVPPNTNIFMEVELLEVIKGEPIPDFRRLDAGKLQANESGLKFEVLKEGEGEPAGPEQCVKFKFVLWNAGGELVMCTQASQFHVMGFRAKCNLPRLPEQFRPKFLDNAVALMKVGSRVLFEVPPELGWGKRALFAKLPANSKTFWQLELVKVYEVPKFQKTPAEKLKTTDSGLGYEVVREGTGAQPIARDKVKVMYTGWTLDGKRFDSSHLRDEPITFSLGGVIKGWTEGLQLMKEGAIYRFRIPRNLAYGDNPKRGQPAGTLIFLVELVAVVR